MVDFLVILIVLVSGLWGYVRGILRRLLSLGSLVVAYLGSAPLGPSFGDMVAARTTWPGNVTYVVGRAAAGILIYVSLSVGCHVADRKFGYTKVGMVRRWNRNWGALGGLLSGVLLALILLFVGDSFLKAFPDASGSFVDSARNSTFVGLVSGFNPADRFLVTDCLRLLRVARDDPEVLRRLSERGEVRSLLDHPDVQSVLGDEELAAAVHRGQVDKVFKNENLRRLLRNSELRQRMLSPEVRAALTDVTRDAPREGDGPLDETGE